MYMYTYTYTYTICIHIRIRIYIRIRIRIHIIRIHILKQTNAILLGDYTPTETSEKKWEETDKQKVLGKIALLQNAHVVGASHVLLLVL